MEIWFADTDSDGFGNPLQALESCDPLDGFVQNNEDCNDNNPEEYPDQVWYLDADGDGYGALSSPLTQCAQPTAHVLNSEDCDDMDSTRNPDSLWYTDNDGDGFGDASLALQSCEDVSEAVANDIDCDDSNAEVHPNAEEVCDYIDNDCDALTDNADPSLNDYGEVALYLDEDGDGYGVDEYVDHGCPSSPIGTPITGDCDDANPAIFPGQFEWPDSTDSNCDGESYFQPPDHYANGFSYSESRSNGSALISEDIDGDGTLDLLIGDIDHDSSRGRVYWQNGIQNADFSTVDNTASTWNGVEPDDGLGGALAALDDLTSDGLAEILVGASGADTVYLLDGNTNGSVSQALWSWTSTEPDSMFGHQIISMGDINQDGSEVFLVTAPLYDTDNYNDGALFVLSTSLVGSIQDPAEAIHIGGLGSNDQLGWSAAKINDADGDGVDEVIVSAIKNGPVNPGLTFLMSATDLVSGLVDLQNEITFEGQSFQQAGSNLSGAGDFNGDGYEDFIIKAGNIYGSSTELGTLYLVHGKPVFAQSNLVEDAEFQVDSSTVNNDFGSQILSAGDINQDGLDDLIFANPLSEYPLSATLNNHGVVFGVFGRTDTGSYVDTDVADFALVGSDNWTNFGTNLLHAGDIDSDGLSDYWISDSDELFLLSGSTLSP